MERLKGGGERSLHEGGRSREEKKEHKNRKRRWQQEEEKGREVGEGGWKGREKEGRRREEKDLKEEPVSISNLPHTLPVNS